MPYGFWVTLFFRAQEQSRTATPFLALPPESSASTNFATCASRKWCKDNTNFYIRNQFSSNYYIKFIRP